MALSKTNINKTLFLTLCTTMFTLQLSAEPLMKINNVEIDDKEFNILLNTSTKNQFNKIPEDKRTILKRQLLEQYTNKKLLALSAKEQKLHETKEYIQKKDEQIKILEENLLVETYFQSVYDSTSISEDEIKKYYNDNINEFTTNDTFSTYHILLQSEDEAKNIIKSILDKKLSNFDDIKKEFISLANSKSIDKTKDGFIGNIELNKVVPEFANALNSMDVKSFSQTPIKTKFGFHIILLDNKIDNKVIEFDVVKNKIDDKLRMKKVQDITAKKLDDLFTKNSVSYFNK